MSENKEEMRHQNFALDIIFHKRNVKLDFNTTVENFVEFLIVFDPNVSRIGDKISWNTIHQKTNELVQGINSYAESVRERTPFVQKLVYDFLRHLSNGEVFFILSHQERTTKEFTALWAKLGKLNEKAGLAKFDESYYDWGATVLNYNIDFIGTVRKSFGNNRGSGVRICRFCRGEVGKLNSFGLMVSFAKKAHLISEALGNKRLISLDECDYCNERFSQSIEPSIVHFFAPFRSLYGIPGKGGKKKLKGHTFELDPEKGFDIQFPGSVLEFPQDNFNMKLELKGSYVPVNVYRSLVKFILAVLPKEQLPNYYDTINWLYGDANKVDLPKVAHLKQSRFYTDHPFLIKYKRNNQNDCFPDLIGEFRYADIVMIFIVPFGKCDQKRFINKTEFTAFWETFIGLRKDLPWEFADFSSAKSIKMAIDLKINNIKLGENAFIVKRDIKE